MPEVTLCIYEDEGYRDLLPLVYFRPTFELRTGVLTLRERILRHFPAARVSYLVRPYLEQLWLPRLGQGKFSPESVPPAGCLFLNGRALLTQGWESSTAESGVWQNGDDLIGFFLSRESVERNFHLLQAPLSSKAIGQVAQGLRPTGVEIRLVRHLWDLVEANPGCVRDDLAELGGGGVQGFVDQNVRVYGSANTLLVASGARVEAGTVIDVSNGPVLIDRGARVRPPSVIDGPCYIGPQTIVDGAKIRGGVSIGASCRVAGEVEASILLDYANKHHDGFLGHAYLGEWVNLGAMTTNSDLKNNYKTVRVHTGERSIDTNLLKVGCFIGDQTKTAIGTMLGTGAVIGVACNIFGGGSPVGGFVPSFSWGGPGEGYREHALDKAVDTGRIVMERRGVSFGEHDRNLWSHIFNLTAEERSGRCR